ncbi:integrin alpha-PS1 isoform X2 [Eupeodes corollae]|uniref:integrin alpha-PS1 isoform X2 n=1 Tax=Eupeodes corollae TaxID=290404 RepID=UPI00249164D1|nr:integrin alpha-PS1 isoform X2 [Eupeodes corollae]
MHQLHQEASFEQTSRKFQKHIHTNSNIDDDDDYDQVKSSHRQGSAMSSSFASNYCCLVFSVVLLIISNSFYAYGFNLENRLPIVKYGDSSTYFGYSIATHVIGEYNIPNNTKWLLVGAPLGKNLQPQSNHSGALFKCPITQSRNDCEQIITDGRRSYDSDDIEELSPPSDDEIKEGQWLGVTVRSQGLGGKVLVCAHRYITKIRENQYGQGLCYVLTNDLKYDEVYEPCKGRTVQRAHEDYGFCQVGTSGALLDDNTMVLGTPGPFTWRGTIFVTEIGGEYLERDKNMYYGDHSESSSPVDKYSYLGMAVTGGRYFGERMSYAAGAPRSNGHGQVVIFNKANSNPIPVETVLEGEQFASSFGYELTTADINGDSEPDLIVSAPFYFSKNEGGAVYIYQNQKSRLPLKATLKLTGAVESRFGTALANIGDINKDNCEDLAIGAPYEESGVVYIYLGSRTGLVEKPAQIIHASDLGNTPIPINTFGSSITGGTDLDDNSYPDIVIGAYNSSAVVALLSRPIISIQTKVRGTELKNIDPTKEGCLTDVSTNLTCFSFEACCSIDPYEQSTRPTDLKLMLTVEAETFSNLKKFSRVFFDRDNKRRNVIKREVTVRTNGMLDCHRVTGYIKENTRDIQSPLKFRLNYTIVEPELPDSGLKALNPILDKTQADIEFEGTFQKDCGDDDTCESNLELDAEIDLDKQNDEYALILGERDELRLSVNISNSADSAYESQLFIVHQKSVTYIAALKTNSAVCNRFNETVVACGLGNPMRRGSTIQVSIRFDPSGLEDEESKLIFDIFANTTSKLIGGIPATKQMVRVVKRADLSLRGWASPEQSFYGGEIKGESAMQYLEDIGTLVTHTYQIYNDGPWKAPKVSLTIYWPHQVANDKKQGKWLLYLEDLPIIEGALQGECTVGPDMVNPLKLPRKAKASMTHEDLLHIPEPYMLRPTNKSHYYNRHTYFDKTESFEKLSTSSDGHLNRVRRDRAKIIRAEKLTDKDGKKHDVVVMDCDKATAFCIKINCELYNMPQKTEAYVHVKARLWNSTFIADYPRVDLVKIVSRGHVRIPTEYAVEQIDSDDREMVETRAYPELSDQARETATPWWIIILSIIGGLILLAIVTYVMHKCGFFKRRRPDPTLSGNIEKMSEEKPFLGAKNKNRIF